MRDRKKDRQRQTDGRTDGHHHPLPPRFKRGDGELGPSWQQQSNCAIKQTLWCLGSTGSLPISMGFYKWAMDALGLLNESMSKVVHSRQTARLQACLTGLGRISPLIRTSGFVRTLSLLLLVWFASPKTPDGFGILIQPALVDAHFRKAWMPYFRREGHPVVSPQTFLEFVGDELPRRPFWISQSSRERGLHDVAMAKNFHCWGA